MAFKKYDYVFTEIAEDDIDQALSYITEELLNTQAAEEFADELETKLDEICKNPKNGRIVENEFLKRDDVRRFLVKNYTVYYIINEEDSKVIVLRVVYGKRDQDKILKDL